MSYIPIDPHFMLRALRLAERGRGFVEPNPVVGCVIVKGGRIVGEGHHRRFGGPHAEVEALRKAGRRARGATVYVTLEPCCHQGKTGPCTEALIAAGVKRVVVACRDPFPAVRGRGIARLRKAGIDVKVGLCEEQARELNAPFFKAVRTGRPYVIAKWAMTADGAIATQRGDSKWISNEQSRALVHQLRGRVDAIVVGIGTVRADDPLLTARGPRPRRIARRVVIDPRLRLPLGSQLVRSVPRAPLTVATSSQAAPSKANRLRDLGIEVLTLPAPEGKPSRRPGFRRDHRLDLGVLLRHLRQVHHATNVLVEGGGVTLGAFFELDLVDEAWVFIGPKVLGDVAAVRPVSHEQNLPDMRLAKALHLRSLRRIGSDVFSIYRVRQRTS